MWLGTEFGLNRYNGYQVMAVSGNDNPFIGKAIRYLFQDLAGSLWISTLNLTAIYQSTFLPGILNTGILSIR
ncbi:MAG: ligand-binding sensor domain-containing protein [Paraglaciecola sp.]